MTIIWYPEPLTPAEVAATAVATDVAGQVEAAPWSDAHLTPEDRKALR